MRHALGSEDWKNLLPDSYEWLGQVSVAPSADKVSGAHHVVAVRPSDDNKDDFTVLGPKDSQAALAAAARDLGWRPGAGAVHLKLDDATFTLVPLTSVKTSAQQVARQLGLDTAKATKDLKLSHVVFCGGHALNMLDQFEGYAAGLYGAYGFKGSRKRDTGKFPAKVGLGGDKVSESDIRNRVELARAVTYTRFLQDGPANYINPPKLAEIAADMARDGGVKCKIYDKKQLQDLGMGLFLSVSDGSVVEPRMIVIEIDGVDNSRSVALIGKGLTFDSGGVSIKPSAGMEEMKYDMSGGAAVLGAAAYLAKVKPPVKVVLIVGATENMCSGSATRPGDIVRAMNGKTVEIHNTDAEGRLVLADLLHFAAETYKPELMIDIATLTGAVLIALGCVGSAVISNDSSAAQFVTKAGEAQGEPLWQLPMWPELEKEAKADVADLKNIAKPSVKAGTIMGGVFLKEFVGKTRWVHLDIAGTGWNCQATGYPGAGGSAFGLKTMVEACMMMGK